MLVPVLVRGFLGTHPDSQEAVGMGMVHRGYTEVAQAQGGNTQVAVVKPVADMDWDRSNRLVVHTGNTSSAYAEVRMEMEAVDVYDLLHKGMKAAGQGGQ